MGQKETAIRLLSNYFRTAFEAAGLKWDSDNEADISYLVELLLQGRADVQPAAGHQSGQVVEQEPAGWSPEAIAGAIEIDAESAPLGND